MEEENEILGPQQAWSPEMLFVPSVEEEEEEEIIKDKPIEEEKIFVFSPDEFAEEIKSPDFNDLSDNQKLRLQEQAAKQIQEQYDDNEDYFIDQVEIDLKANSIFQNEILPKVSFDKLNSTEIEKFTDKYTPILNPVSDFLGDLYRDWKRGSAQSKTIDPVFELIKNGAQTTPEDIEAYIDANKKAMSIVQSDEMRDFNKIYEANGKGVLGFIKGAAANPTILPSLFVSSLATQLGSLRSDEVRETALLTGAAGAAGGSVIPGAGTVTAGLGGLIMGGVASMEMALTFSELLQEEVGEDLDVDKIKVILEDPKKLSDLRKKAAARGVTIGVVEGLTAGLAKGITGKAIKAGLSKPKAALAGTTVEAAGGSLGEIGGRIAADQEQDVAQILFEGTVGGVTTAPLTVGLPLIESQTKKLNNTIANYQINKEIKGTNFTDIKAVFEPTNEISEAAINLSQNSKVKSVLEDKLKQDIVEGKITPDKSIEIRTQYRDIEGATQKLNKIGLENNTEAVNLIIEKNKLSNIIKEVDDSALTQEEISRVNEINTRLSELASDAKAERDQVVGMSILPTRRTTPKADELALQYQENPAEADVEALLDQYNKIGLAAIKFDTRKGDMAREDAIAEINKEFAGIMERWSPDQGAFSTFVTANIAPKAQGIYDKYIGQRDVTTLDKPEAREVVAEEIDVDVTPTETARPKVYPATLEVITENITPEVRSEQTTMIKDDINRAVATVSTSPKAVAKNIVNQIKTKEYRQLLKDKLGRWNTEQYNNNVDRLITKDFIATLPVAQLKRRFPRLFEIEVIDRVPTVKIEDGKRTDFKKPVYRIPAITDAKLETIKDYFKANEKRHQSLMEVLGEGIAIEQMQELKGDQAFMTDLQGRLELKGSNLTAEQFLNEVEYNLDKRNLEDKSLDVVEGTVDSVVNEMITEDNVNDIEADVLSEAISKLETFRKTNLSMNALTGVVEAGLRTLRAAKNAGKSFLSAIKDFTKSIKDFIKKPTTRKTTPKKPTPKKPAPKKPVSTGIKIQEYGKIARSNMKTIINEKLLPKVYKGESITPKEKSERKVGMITYLYKMGSDMKSNYNASQKEALYNNIKEIDVDINSELTPAEVSSLEKSNVPIIERNGKFYYDKSKAKTSVELGINEKININGRETTVLAESRKEQKEYKLWPVRKIKAMLGNKKWENYQQAKLRVLKKIAKTIESDLKQNPNNKKFWASWLNQSNDNIVHPVRALAPITFFSDQKGIKVAEHTFPANHVSALIMNMALKETVDIDFKNIKRDYKQGSLLKLDDEKLKGELADGTKFNYVASMPDAFFDIENPSTWMRYINEMVNDSKKGPININKILVYKNGKVVTLAESLGLPLSKANQSPDNIHAQNELLFKVFTNALDSAGNIWNIAKARKVLKSAEPTNNLSSKQVNNNKENLFNLIKENSTTEQSIIDMSNADQAAQIARDINAPTKGISVFDFDDTLAYSNSKVIVNMPDGKVRKITPAEFAVQSESLLEQGAEFDFSEFNKVVKGRKGPLADLALKRQEKFGSGDIFVLTARPQASATSIKAFLDGIGLNIPLKNITGLEDGSPNAKALWVLDKAAKGYNDFYFADDALPNVQAVKNILDQIDVKSDVQQAKQNKPKDLNKEFNVIIEQQSGKEWFKTYSEARAKVQGKAKNRFEFFIPPSAEDFMGLMYKIVPKGRDGDRALVWIKENLLNPYNKAEQEVIAAKISVANDFNELRNSIDNIPNNLQKQAGYSNFTWSQALRVYMWNIQGIDIPGLSTRDNNALVKIIEDNADMKVFAEKIAFIQKNKEYPAPGANWVGGSITSDIINSIQKTYRKEALAEWQQNVDIIFSETNMNKLEALYGSNYVVALNNILNRMKRGNNRPVSSSKQVENVIDWLNNSVGTIMFLNRKSALLQLISSINFINWSDNNIAAAGRAFANQPQYWKDVMYLMNSDYLVQRRNGMRINVAESEIADASKKGGLKGVIAYLLNKGFIFTRIADSLAIATGGATFYRNRVNSLQKQVNIDTGKLYTKEEADTKAFEDFYQISEESQQSSRADRISMQQASGLGRLVLNFANTPMQYARIIKKSTKDLLAGRGDWKTNLSKILYYGAVQNLIFSGLQAALFTILFDEEEEKKDRTVSDKAENIGFNMLSSLLRGLGYGGALVDTVVAVSRELAEQQGKKSPDYEEAVWNIFDFSPAIDSKVRKLRSAANTFKFNRKEIARRGFNLENPAYLALGQVVSSTLNVPLDRALRMAMTLKQASDQDIALWQRIALIAGYSSWSVNLPYWGTTTTIEREAQEDEEIKVKYKKDTEKLKDKGFKRIPMTKGKPAGELGKDFITVTRPSGSIEYWLMPKK